MSFGLLFRLHDERLCSDDGWFRCLRCFRFCTKRPDDLYCYDCVQEIRARGELLLTNPE